VSFNLCLKQAQFPTATTTLDTAAAGSTVVCSVLSPKQRNYSWGTISALVTITTATNTLTLRPRLQVSRDGTTYYDIAGQNGTTRTGTGSPVTTSEVLAVPDGVVWPYVRVVIAVGVTTAAAADTFQISWNFVDEGQSFGAGPW
jgi:hypothetical protein